MHLNDTTNEIPYGYCKCGCGQLTPIASRIDKRFGHIKGEPKPYFKPSHKKRMSSPSPEDSFWSRVNTNGPIHPVLKTACWTWLGGKGGGGGYGQLATGSAIDGTRAIHRAHRFSYELHYGSIPDGLQVLHKCDNPPCVNPSHLWLGTNSDNMQDMHKKGRANHSTRPRGEAKRAAKLTDYAVIQIRTLSKQGVPHREIARQFSVSPSCAWNVIHRKRWKHIP